MVMGRVDCAAGIPAGGIDVSGPKTAPGATKSFLPRSGFAALGGGPDYSTVLSWYCTEQSCIALTHILSFINMERDYSP